ncbi:MAG: hypothetical protein Q8R16_03240 [bacterium]|nr:hypothetical protein [bacterium]
MSAFSQKLIVKQAAPGEMSLPPEAFQLLGFTPGDAVRILVTEGGPCIVAEDDAYFYTDKWQAKEREADEAIARGEISGPYATVEEALTALHKRSGRDGKDECGG